MGGSIILVHRQRETAAFFGCLVQDDGYQVHVAGSEKQFNALVSEHSPLMLILDSYYMDPDGTRLVGRINSGHYGPEISEIPILILDTLDILPQKSVDKAVEDDVIFGCLKPPFSGANLLNMIQVALDDADIELEAEKLAFEFTYIQLAKLILIPFLFDFTGQMELSREGVSKFLYFEDGYIVSASSSLSIDRIGNLLISKNLISENQLNEALVSISKSSKMLGQELLDRGWLVERNLEEGLKEQSELIALSLFEWDLFDVSFSADRGKRPPNVVLDTKPFPLARLGVARVLQKKPLEEIFSKTDNYLVPNPDGNIAVDQMELSGQEKEILYAIDGQNLVMNIVERSPLPTPETENFLASLILTGFLTTSPTPSEKEVNFKAVPPLKPSDPAFTEEFFATETLPADPMEPPPITTEELELTLKDLDEQEREQELKRLAGQGGKSGEEIEDEELNGLNARSSDPVRYLIIVGILLSFFALFIVVIGYQPDNGKMLDNRKHVDDSGAELKPIFFKAVQNYDNAMMELEKGDSADLEKVRELLIKALDADPGYEPALVALEKVEKMQQGTGSDSVPGADDSLSDKDKEKKDQSINGSPVPQD